MNRASAEQQPATVNSQLPDSPEPQSLGSISGTVTDRDGAIIPSAGVTLTLKAPADHAERTTVSGTDGRFSFIGVPIGGFTLTVTASGFATQQASGELQPGQTYEVAAISLPVSTSIEIQAVSQRELAEQQIKEEEKQRVLGFIPNYYVSYEPNAVPLDRRQKFELAWKTAFDPITFGLSGVAAGIQQSQDDFNGYGQGVEGYSKRYAASYATFFTETMLGNAVLPALLKQDPRYFYKGTGSTRSRAFYAIANAIICKGDNGRWQPNYSSILGSLAAGGISNLYYPAQDRNGAELTFENAAFGIAGSAASNLFQEFVVRKLTPHVHHSQAAKP